MRRPPSFSSMLLRPRTERRLTRHVGRTRRCFIMITSAVPPAITFASVPNSLSVPWTSLRFLGVRYSKGIMRLSLFDELVCLLDRFDNLIVARAAAEIAHHPIFDFFFVRFRLLIKERLGRNHLTGSANAALKTAVLDKALLDRMQLAVFGQALDRGYVMTVGEHCQSQAGTDHVSVHQDRASAAHTDTAAFFCACQAEIVTQKVNHQAVRWN